MNFDDLQKSWVSQPIDEKSLAEMQVQVMDRLYSQQRKLKRNTVIGTTAFALVFVNIVWVYIRFREGHTFLFTASLLAMLLTMVVYLWVLWKGVMYSKEILTDTSLSHVDRCLENLRWRRKTITIYSWVYAVLLWISFMFYTWDVCRHGGLMLRIGAPLVITVYIFGAMLIVRYTKKKKHLKEIDKLLADLHELKKNMV